MDIIKYSDDPAEYIAAALSPADVISVEPLPDGSHTVEPLAGLPVVKDW